MGSGDSGLTSERLAEIRKRWSEREYGQLDTSGRYRNADRAGAWNYWLVNAPTDEGDLLAEVERQRAALDMAALAVQSERDHLNGYRAEMAEELERLRAALDAKEAREAALVSMLAKLISAADATYVDVRPYAGVGHTKIVGPFPASLEQARALLASADEQGEA